MNSMIIGSVDTRINVGLESIMGLELASASVFNTNNICTSVKRLNLIFVLVLLLILVVVPFVFMFASVAHEYKL